MDSMTMTLISGAGVALAGAIGALWKYIIKVAESNEKKAVESQKRHDENQRELVRMSNEMGVMQGKISTAEGIKPKLDSIEELAQKTLNEVSST